MKVEKGSPQGVVNGSVVPVPDVAPASSGPAADVFSRRVPDAPAPAVVASSTARRVVSPHLAQPPSRPVIEPSVLPTWSIAQDGAAALVPGTGVGKVVVMTLEEFEARGHLLAPETLLVTDGLSRLPYPVLEGVVVVRPVTLEGAHNLDFFGGLRTPVVCPGGAEAGQLAFWRRLEAGAANCRLEVREGAAGLEIEVASGVSELEAASFRARKHPRLQVDPTVSSLGLVDANAGPGAAGQKLTLLRRLGAVLPFNVPELLCIGSGLEARLRAAVDTRLDLSTMATLHASAERVRSDLLALPFEPFAPILEPLYQALLEQCPRLGFTPHRWRSNSNHEEDLAAGLYTSLRATADTPQALFAIMKEIYASQFSPRAILARRAVGLGESDCRMAILVHASIDHEVYNGVADVSSHENGVRVALTALPGSEHRVTDAGSADPLIRLEGFYHTKGSVDLAVPSPVGDDLDALARRVTGLLARAYLEMTTHAETWESERPMRVEWVARQTGEGGALEPTFLQAKPLGRRLTDVHATHATFDAGTRLEPTLGFPQGSPVTAVAEALRRGDHVDAFLGLRAKLIDTDHGAAIVVGPVDHAQLATALRCERKQQDNWRPVLDAMLRVECDPQQRIESITLDEPLVSNVPWRVRGDGYTPDQVRRLVAHALLRDGGAALVEPHVRLFGAGPFACINGADGAMLRVWAGQG